MTNEEFKNIRLNILEIKSQTKLGKLIDFHQKTISEFETGKRKVSRGAEFAMQDLVRRRKVPKKELV